MMTLAFYSSTCEAKAGGGLSWERGKPGLQSKSSRATEWEPDSEKKKRKKKKEEK